MNLLDKKENIQSEIETSSEFIRKIYIGLGTIENVVKKLDITHDNFFKDPVLKSNVKNDIYNLLSQMNSSGEVTYLIIS